MTDEDIDLSEVPEITEEEMDGAMLLIGGKPVPEGKSLVAMLLDTEVIEYFRARARGSDFQALINRALRESMARA